MFKTENFETRSYAVSGYTVDSDSKLISALKYESEQNEKYGKNWIKSSPLWQTNTKAPRSHRRRRGAASWENAARFMFEISINYKKVFNVWFRSLQTLIFLSSGLYSLLWNAPPPPPRQLPFHFFTHYDTTYFNRWWLYMCISMYVKDIWTFYLNNIMSRQYSLSIYQLFPLKKVFQFTEMDDNHYFEKVSRAIEGEKLFL